MSDLLSCNIIEKDNNEDILWSWTYPALGEKQKNVIMRKCLFNTSAPFLFGQYYEKWFYISYKDVGESSVLPNVKQFALVLWAKDMNPEKYQKLCHILSKTYQDSGNPTSVLKLYLNVIIKGACTGKENGTFLVRDFGTVANSTRKTIVKELIKLFGLEVILIYTVLLVKKRLVVYHHNLNILQEWIQSFPLLVSHRNSADHFYPWLDLTTEDMGQLKGKTCYTAGFYDNTILSHTDTYDVLVNLPAREISIAPHAKESLTMTKIHKEIALYMVQLSESEFSESQVVKAIADKTLELLNHIRSIGNVMEDGRCLVSVEMLKEKNLSPAAENFLFQLALAENMLLL